MISKNRTLGKLLTTSNADIYTVPSRYTGYIFSILVSNEAATPTTISLDWYDSASGTYYAIMKTVSVNANSVMQISDEPLVLQAGDKIRGLAGSNSAITVSIKVQEEFATAL